MNRRLRPRERWQLERIREQLRTHRQRVAAIIRRITRELEHGKIEAMIIGAAAGTLIAFLIAGRQC